ncbi:MAG TPA: flippase activity-associated protein Agl23 [Verrucomicrobiae bacterium]|nr:flippase activity-associated protein Agl23 [Verrucomicrobiae bacterium]
MGIALLALAIRAPHPGERPMHTDEAINAYITGELLAGKPYKYDNKDRHGPALYALAFPLARLAGAKNFAQLTEASVRVGPVIVGALTILLFGFFARRMGFGVAAVGALLFAISPLPVYYSRDFIHETLFVAATLGFIIFAFRVVENKSINDGILAGVSAGLMLACKETTVIHFAAFGIAAAWWFWASRPLDKTRRDWCAAIKPAVAALVSFCVVMVALYTWWGRHWQGLLDLVHAVPHLAARAGGEGHQKPAWYYLALLAGGWSGAAVIALAIWGIISRRDETRANKPLQALIIYTIAITILYSAIPYKTPWLALNLFLPMSLLAGRGLANLWEAARDVRGSIFVVLFAAALATALCHDTWKRVFAAPADERNPYAYAQTVDDILRLPERIQQVAAHNPSGNNLRIAVVAADPWPLPWYLRHFPNVGFWQPNQDPGQADVYITSGEASDKLGSLTTDWRTEFFGVRPEVLLVMWLPPENKSSHE